MKTMKLMILSIALTSITVSMVKAQNTWNGTTTPTLTTNGKIGIGTTAPTANIVVYTNQSAGKPSLEFRKLGSYSGTNNVDYVWSFTQTTNNDLEIKNGYCGINQVPGVEVKLKLKLNQLSELSTSMYRDLDNSAYFLDLASTGLSLKVAGAISAASLSTTGNTIISGNVGIGCTNPTVKLAVNGKIQATEIEILAVPCVPDYVFEKSYKLMNLKDLESFVATNKHLPEVPSAAEFKERGMNISEMNNLLLKKVEELSLYAIQLQNQIDELKKESK